MSSTRNIAKSRPSTRRRSDAAIVGQRTKAKPCRALSAPCMLSALAGCRRHDLEPRDATLELAGDPSLVHREDAIALVGHFIEVAGDHEDGAAAVRQAANQLIKLVARADIDPER